MECAKSFDLVINGATILGSAGAKAAMIAFSDFQSSFCGKYASDTFNAIRTGTSTPRKYDMHLLGGYLDCLHFSSSLIA